MIDGKYQTKKKEWMMSKGKKAKRNEASNIPENIQMLSCTIFLRGRWQEDCDIHSLVILSPALRRHRSLCRCTLVTDTISASSSSRAVGNGLVWSDKLRNQSLQEFSEAKHSGARENERDAMLSRDFCLWIIESFLTCPSRAHEHAKSNLCD